MRGQAARRWSKPEERIGMVVLLSCAAPDDANGQNIDLGDGMLAVL